MEHIRKTQFGDDARVPITVRYMDQERVLYTYIYEDKVRIGSVSRQYFDQEYREVG